jgi:TonB family protein
MFEQPPTRRRSTRSQIVSFLLHAALIYLLVRPPAPLFLTPLSVQRGNNGHATTLVFTGRNRAAIADSEDATPIRRELAYIPPNVKTISLRPPERRSNTKPKKKAEQMVPDAARAGQVNGSVLDGMLTGHDVRPALPFDYPNPDVYPWQVPNGVQGTVVVEVTIDDHGNVTATKIIQRLGYGIDEKVEAAVRRWRFHPAIMDGRPIPSQQDVLYRFPS